MRARFNLESRAQSFWGQNAAFPTLRPPVPRVPAAECAAEPAEAAKLTTPAHAGLISSDVLSMVLPLRPSEIVEIVPFFVLPA
ncbi:hypothetical protein V502_04013 [Pseudogymnoascus sp. VKM F-4520 (FW-2644)]|nr:hypothetical protein V502_04013 [Pseudogymnoascus sp. VKM F-4520 (FW-2644)]